MKPSPSNNLEFYLVYLAEITEDDVYEATDTY
jgi:mannonate dehydratase